MVASRTIANLMGNTTDVFVIVKGEVISDCAAIVFYFYDYLFLCCLEENKPDIAQIFRRDDFSEENLQHETSLQVFPQVLHNS